MTKQHTLITLVLMPWKEFSELPEVSIKRDNASEGASFVYQDNFITVKLNTIDYVSMYYDYFLDPKYKYIFNWEEWYEMLREKVLEELSKDMDVIESEWFTRHLY